MAGVNYEEGKLCWDGVSVESVCEKVRTPFYLYSYEKLIENLNRYKEAFSDLPATICYALKANSNGALLAIMNREGLGADVVSGGELKRALAAGIPANKIVFAGVGKTRDEIIYGLEKNILAFNVESREELELIAELAQTRDKVAPVSIRVNPDIDPRTHPYISTGLRENKFGLDFAGAEKGYEFVKENKYLRAVGIHFHIGSQITDTGPFRAAIERVVEFIKKASRKGLEFRFMDIGGGLGIDYERTEPVPDIEEYAEAVKESVDGLEPRPEVIVEPGRSVVGPAGMLVSEVNYVKEKSGRTFVVLDAGMNDFIRPSLYEAHHEIVPVKSTGGRPRIQADVVGPVCESADFFARSREMPAVEAGEKLAILDTGAYGYSMASNYNSRPRPAEVLVRDGNHHLIRKREEIADVVRGEILPSFLD